MDENTIIIKTSKPSPVGPRAKRVLGGGRGERERKGEERESAPASPPRNWGETLRQEAAWPLCRGRGSELMERKEDCFLGGSLPTGGAAQHP